LRAKRKKHYEKKKKKCCDLKTKQKIPKQNFSKKNVEKNKKMLQLTTEKF